MQRQGTVRRPPAPGNMGAKNATFKVRLAHSVYTASQPKFASTDRDVQRTAPQHVLIDQLVHPSVHDKTRLQCYFPRAERQQKSANPCRWCCTLTRTGELSGIPSIGGAKLNACAPRASHPLRQATPRRVPVMKSGTKNRSDDDSAFSNWQGNRVHVTNFAREGRHEIRVRVSRHVPAKDHVVQNVPHIHEKRGEIEMMRSGCPTSAPVRRPEIGPARSLASRRTPSLLPHHSRLKG